MSCGSVSRRVTKAPKDEQADARAADAAGPDIVAFAHDWAARPRMVATTAEKSRSAGPGCGSVQPSTHGLGGREVTPAWPAASDREAHVFGREPEHEARRVVPGFHVRPFGPYRRSDWRVLKMSSMMSDRGPAPRPRSSASPRTTTDAVRVVLTTSFIAAPVPGTDVVDITEHLRTGRTRSNSSLLGADVHIQVAVGCLRDAAPDGGVDCTTPSPGERQPIGTCRARRWTCR